MCHTNIVKPTLSRLSPLINVLLIYTTILSTISALVNNIDEDNIKMKICFEKNIKKIPSHFFHTISGVCLRKIIHFFYCLFLFSCCKIMHTLIASTEHSHAKYIAIGQKQKQKQKK